MNTALAGTIALVGPQGAAHSASANDIHAAARRAAAAVPMVTIPAGQFIMGDLAGDGRESERPVHAVRVKAFRLARYEVTVGDFRAFVKATGYRTDAERDVEALPTAITGCGLMVPGKMVYTAGARWDAPQMEQTDRSPVSCVSWNDAQQYIRWLNAGTGRHFRLASEAEWEYAARAGSRTSYYWGDNADDGCGFANGADQPRSIGMGARRMRCDDGAAQTAKVGSYAPNRFGLYDMIGNVREWTEDCWNDSYVGAPSDGSPWIEGNCARRIARGSSWFGDPVNMRVASRGAGVTPARDVDMGFRLAEDPPVEARRRRGHALGRGE